MEPRIDAKELRQIYEQAVLWMLRKEAGPLNRAERRRYLAWLNLPHRAQALQRMEAFSAQLNQPWRRRRLVMRLAASEQSAAMVPA